MLLPQIRWVVVAGVAGLGLLSGCAGISSESSPRSESTADAPAGSEAKAGTDSPADKPAIVAESATSSSRSSSASAAATPEPRSSWRESRGTESRSTASESRSEPARSTASASTRESSGSGAESANLVAQLNEASRELATLRAANARLRAERDRPAPVSSSRATEPALKADPMEEKIAASLKSYSALKQELAGFLAEIERGRAENAAASAKLKDAVSRSDESRTAIAKLESELRAERRARADAEQAAAKVQEQLRTIARALSAAGLSVDKLAAGAESANRRE